jgi:hypothetical protein
MDALSRPGPHLALLGIPRSGGGFRGAIFRGRKHDTRNFPIVGATSDRPASTVRLKSRAFKSLRRSPPFRRQLPTACPYCPTQVASFKISAAKSPAPGATSDGPTDWPGQVASYPASRGDAGLAQRLCSPCSPGASSLCPSHCVHLGGDDDLGAKSAPRRHGSSGKSTSYWKVGRAATVIDEFRTDVTTARKDGSLGWLLIDYGDPRTGRSSGSGGSWTARGCWRSLHSRAIVVLPRRSSPAGWYCAQSSRSAPRRRPSHKDHARKALAKLAGPHLPATLKQLEKAIEKAHRAYEHGQQHANPSRPRRSRPTVRPTPRTSTTVTMSSTRGDHDPFHDVVAGDVVDPGGAVGPDGQVHSDADPGL